MSKSCVFLALAAALGAGSPAVAQSAAPPRCQALTAGVNTLKGVLYQFHLRGAGAEPSRYALRLDRPLCAPEAAMKLSGPATGSLQGMLLMLDFQASDPRRFVGRRVLISGALAPSTTDAAQAVLQVGSMAPLPVVAAGKT
jgi:hypothetical protein